MPAFVLSATIDVESYADREDEGILLVRKAGEVLFHWKDQPEWVCNS